MVPTIANKSFRQLERQGKGASHMSKTKVILYHLYPGLLITLVFTLLGPLVIQYGYPPQLAILIAIALVAVPVFYIHLSKAKKEENTRSIYKLNGLSNKLPRGKLILYSVALLIVMYLIWGLTQPLNKIITEKVFYWLPEWYTVQDFAGYGKKEILITLVFNFLLNGFIAPWFEELYFRGYLLSRMNHWGKKAVVVNTILFSLYHFWQPYIYVTLIVSLLPMIWLVWKTKDLRLAILTHSLLNLVGALASFGLVNK